MVKSSWHSWAQLMSSTFMSHLLSGWHSWTQHSWAQFMSRTHSWIMTQHKFFFSSHYKNDDFFIWSKNQGMAGVLQVLYFMVFDLVTNKSFGQLWWNSDLFRLTPVRMTPMPFMTHEPNIHEPNSGWPPWHSWAQVLSGFHSLAKIMSLTFLSPTFMSPTPVRMTFMSPTLESKSWVKSLVRVWEDRGSSCLL